jgi:hypothetical protein
MMVGYQGPDVEEAEEEEPMSGKPIPAAMVAAEEAAKTAEHRRASNEERELQSAHTHTHTQRDADLRKQAAEVRGFACTRRAIIHVCMF